MRAALERLAAAPWLGTLRPLLESLDGARSRAVGGIVRDTLLGRVRADADFDVATELVPEEVTARATAAGFSVHPTGLAHGTVTVSGKGFSAEVTTLREDVATDGRHAVVRFGTDWHRDAARRDFTMNALYADADGTLFDPLGGLSDCLAQRVRFIGDPDARIAEDRLRVYRFFRFSASHGRGTPDADGTAACARAAQALDGLARERVGAEMTRMLALPRVAAVLDAMVAVDILPETVFTGPAMSALARYEDWAETQRLAGRLAILGLAGGLAWICAQWRLSRAREKEAARLVDAARLAGAGDWNGLAYRFADVREDALAAWAAWNCRAGKDYRKVREAALAVTAPDFPLDGSALMAAGIAAGPELGATLERLESAWIESGFSLSRQALLERARR